LIGRILDSGKTCGIYKITNNINNKVYIGQSVNLKDRLKTHIKKGLGAEVATNNKLYQSLKNEGVENFSYNIVEYCTREELNQKEKFWIEYYHAYDYGYNETRGNG
jgi:group I intron endonuclease